MSKIHVLTVNGKQYQVVLHSSVPPSNNAAGKPWVDVLTKVGLTGKASTLVEGAGPGEISTVENDQLKAGTLIEFETTIQMHQKPDLTDLTQLEVDIDSWLAEKRSEIVATYGMYGREI